MDQGRSLFLLTLPRPLVPRTGFAKMAGMQTLAVSTFSLFLVALLAKSLSGQNQDRLDQNLSQERASVFSSDRPKEVVRQELDALAAVVTPAQQPPKEEPQIVATVPDFTQMQRELHSAFVDQFIDLDHVRSLQAELQSLKLEHNLAPANTETWDLFLLYYLYLNEGLGWDDINQITSLEELYPNPGELSSITRYTLSNEFLREVLQQLGVEAIERHVANESRGLNLKNESEDSWTNYQELTKEQKAIYDHLEEFKLSPDQVRELVQGYHHQQPRY